MLLILLSFLVFVMKSTAFTSDQLYLLSHTDVYDKMDVLPSLSKDTAAEVLDINQDQTEHNEKRKFVLPPEYDENNSRWTLKYREPAPGLVELIDDTGVYVNAEKLAECKKLTNDCNKFARMLLTEIFTSDALRTCSWTSETTNASDIRSGLARPGLDEHAKNILLMFFQEYGDLHNWNLTEYLCCLNSVRRTLLEMRHCRQKEEENYSDETFSLTDFRQTMLEMIQNVQEEEENSEGQRRWSPPPEYNENDSRWTLRYQRPAPGLVELMPHTCVYVNAENLASTVLLPNDCITLARKLLNQIFTLRALRVCSWAGPTAKDSEQPNFRPGLNENAMTTLLNFVAEFQLMNDRIIITGNKESKKNIEPEMEVLEAVETQETSNSPVLIEEEIRESPRKKQKTSNTITDETASSSRNETSEGIKLTEDDDASNDEEQT